LFQEKDLASTRPIRSRSPRSS